MLRPLSLMAACLLVASPPSPAPAQEAPAEPRPNWAPLVADAPTVQVLVPGFRVRELPVDLTNINNVEYAPDGRLFAAGYDGRLHLLRDGDGDGLEDQVRTFHDQASGDYPLGIAVKGDSLYVAREFHIARHRDADGDGIPDREEKVATLQDPPVPAPFLDKRRVSGGIGLAVGPDGSLYVSTGSLNTFGAYMLAGPDGKPLKPEDRGRPDARSMYDLGHTAGTVLRFPPGGAKPEIVATGVRYITSLQFNRHGDLFGTDQEGATWVPDGNPFDELLQIQTGRHYGFPARHPKHLPGVIDEPSVFDYAPQHQSTCGFRFDEPIADGKPIFGPAWWLGDAFVTGESRGKLFRTQLVKTPAGYVAKNQVLACLAMLTVDVALSPTGDLVVACHGGDPDWGTGPAGKGRLFKISYSDPAAPLPVAAWAASPTETRIEFDRPLRPADWQGLARGARVEGGPHVAAGDRFEKLRPGYAVVQNQGKAPREAIPVVSAALGGDGRSILLRTPARTRAVGYSVTLPYPASTADPASRTLHRSQGIDMGLDLTGVQATWRPSDGGEGWSGWLPHPDWSVASALTVASAFHDALRDATRRPGTLTLAGQLDLWSMLHPAVQPGSAIDFAHPPETVAIRFASASPLTLAATAPGRSEPSGSNSASLVATPEQGRWIPFTLTVATGPGPLSLDVAWSTAEDPRPRALPLRRVLMPWATAPAAPLAIARPAAIEGGDWQAGKAVFFGSRANCASCHNIRGEGGTIGPELTNLIHRDYDSVLKDVREPSAAINPDFLAYSVALHDGRVLTGVLNGSNDRDVRVGSADGKVTTIPAAEVAETAPSKLSIMPEKLLDALTPTEVRDLFTFLLTEAPAKARP